MRKIIMACLVCLVLCSCSYGPDKAITERIDDLRFSCIKGHLYIRSNLNYGVAYAPLFAEDSDVPMLVRCSRKNGDVEDVRYKSE